MKSLVRVFVFTFIALYSTQYLIRAFVYGENEVITFILVWISLSALYYLLKPVLGVITLPSKGLGYLFLAFVLTFAVLYVLTLFIPSFSIKPTSLSGLIIFGFMLPSKNLTSLWAGLFSAFVVSVVYLFLQGLCNKK
jgi:uncharacterized membrane protein YvlD (DUF360 family)